MVDPAFPFELPEEDLSTDPQALRRGTNLWDPCGGGWTEGWPPAADAVLVDVFFGEQGFLDIRQPLLYQRRIVERHGGVILRSYYLPGMRVWLPTDSILGLEAEQGVELLSVPDPRRYDVKVFIEYLDDTDFEPEATRIRELGGVVLSGPPPLPDPPVVASVVLPNRAIPEIRDRPTVVFVKYSGFPGCFF